MSAVGLFAALRCNQHAAQDALLHSLSRGRSQLVYGVNSRLFSRVGYELDSHFTAKSPGQFALFSHRLVAGYLQEEPFGKLDIRNE